MIERLIANPMPLPCGLVVTRRLEHENGEAKTYYASLPKASLIGIEATGYTQWFERMVGELGHELWVGDPVPEFFGRCVLKNGIEPFHNLIEKVMEQEPYQSAARVFWIMDNCSAHRGQKRAQRLQARWPWDEFFRGPLRTCQNISEA